MIIRYKTIKLPHDYFLIITTSFFLKKNNFRLITNNLTDRSTTEISKYGLRKDFAEGKSKSWLVDRRTAIFHEG